jgi:hypothetical protein
VSLFTPLTANAQSLLLAYTYKVTAEKGLNLRDKDCNYIQTLKYGTILNSVFREEVANDSITRGTSFDGTPYRGEDPITCTTNGKTHTMIAVTYTYGPNFDANRNSIIEYLDGYVALDWVQQVLVDVIPSFEAGFYMYVDASIGLNVRDQNCQKITALVDGSQVPVDLYSPLNEIFCEVKGQTYAMQTTTVKVNGENRTGYVATAFMEEISNTQKQKQQTAQCIDSYMYMTKYDSCKFHYVPGANLAPGQKETIPATYSN